MRLETVAATGTLGNFVFDLVVKIIVVIDMIMNLLSTHNF